MRRLVVLLFLAGCADEVTCKRAHWEAVSSPGWNERPILRTRTPEGWLVTNEDEVVYVPDVQGVWLMDAETEGEVDVR